MHRSRYLLLWCSCLFLVLAACTPGTSPTATPELSTLTPASLTTVPALSATSTQVPTASAATGQPAVCPSATAGTQLMKHKEHGYCLLYPDGYVRVDPLPYEVCLVPEGPAMACHSAAAFFEVSDAAGRSASQVADELIEQLGLSIERSSLTLANEEAVVLANVPSQAGTRDVLFVHDDRLYTLKFVLPDAVDPSAVERFEHLYTTVINSFTLIPTVPSPAPTEAMGPTSCSLLVNHTICTSVSWMVRGSSLPRALKGSPPLRSNEVLGLGG